MLPLIAHKEPKCPTRLFDERMDEVDIGDAPLRVEIYAREETVEIFVEADLDTMPEERRRFALINIPRHLYSEAAATAARRAPSPVLHPRRDE